LLCTMVGFLISGNINYYKVKGISSCQDVMRQAFTVILLGYFEMLKCFCCGCLLCVFLPIVFIAARRAQ
jgi:hypothetical protein